MRHPFLALSLACFATLTTACQAEVRPSDPAVKAALQSVIERQLTAFRADDYRAAYGFAHAGIKSQFPAEAFEAMVRAQYPQIANSTGARFLVAIDDGEKAAVSVEITGTDGQTIEYQYLLQRDSDTWRISGVIQSAPAEPTPIQI